MSGHWLKSRHIPVVGIRRLRAHQNASPVTIRTRLSFMAAFPVLETDDKRVLQSGYLFWLVGYTLFTEPVDINESE